MLEDVDGNLLLDFAGGIGCANAGYSDAGVVAAIQKQSEKYLHTCFMAVPYESYVRLAEKLNAIAPGPSEKRTLFVNSGAEAVENAVKLARAFTKRPAILCFDDAYHGRTYMAMSLTSKLKPYKSGFEPFPGETYRVPYPNPYARTDSMTDCLEHTLNAMRRMFANEVAAERFAAVIVEPVLGEGGFVVPPAAFLPALRSICDRHGILLIADEIQTGLGRTGKLFACEHSGVEPDLLLTSKSLASGLPLAGIIGKAEVMNHPMAGAMGGTFGGNPLACEAALATLEVLEREQLCERSIAIGDVFHRRAIEWQERFSCVGDVRGLGGMQAIELVLDRSTREPATAMTQALARYACEHGVLLVTAGAYGNVIRLLVPLVIDDDALREGLNVIEDGLAEICATETK